jgi:DnaJ-class molecular chaperone
MDNPTPIDPLEIAALARIMDELDYYQLLGVTGTATSRDIRSAYHACSRSFHPDANRNLAPDLLAHCTRISKRIAEAYCVLRDTRRRRAYDERRRSAGALRIHIAEARQSHAEQRRAAARGATPEGRQFHARAEKEIKEGRLGAAAQSLQMALTFEPQNAGFRALADSIRARQQADG